MLKHPGRFSPLLHADRPPRGQPWPNAQAYAAWRDAMEDYRETQEPTVKALVPSAQAKTWPRLTTEADAGPLPQLAGLLLGVKDVFHARGFPTQAGTDLPARILQGQEASAVSRLRMAGAHVIGKTATTEFAYLEPGPTANPWHPAYTPGGSSSGSAAGVAAGLFDAGLGTQTVGSIIRPAAFCGVLGYKPSLGRIARDGLLLFSDTVDHVGLMTRDWPTMLAVAAEVVDGWTPIREMARRPVFGLLQDEYLEQAEPAMIGYVQDWSRRLQEAGFEVRPLSLFERFGELAERHTDLNAYEFSFRHRPWCAEFRHLYRPRTRDLIDRGQQISQARWQECRRSCRQLRERIRVRMQEARVDVLISPAAVATAPRGLASTGNPVMNLPWTHAGVPVTTMPMGVAADRHGAQLPAGVQLSAGLGQDEYLLALSQDLYARVPPLPRI